MTSNVKEVSIDRQCAICERPMREGYYCCGEYLCSRDCLDKSFPDDMTWDDHFTEDGDCYFTEWDCDFEEVPYAA